MTDCMNKHNSNSFFLDKMSYVWVEFALASNRVSQVKNEKSEYQRL